MSGGVFTVALNGKKFGWRRDKDVPTLLLRNSASIGFLGSDTFEELDESISGRLVFMPLIETDIRFALAASSEKIPTVTDMIASGEGLVVATSNPRKSTGIAKELGFYIKEMLVLRGSVEAAPDDIPTVDAVVDIVDSGETMRRCGLVPIYDNLGKITIGAAWQSQNGGTNI